ncbi:hypothetical protein [Mucilaginibacter sp. BT774]|uniref:plasmid mobilization protein n=1 Tax=Mucilaginibacter sp. BT774 TaxID=3062276 RepID=UPI00267519A5|nr:hypothetical protein [Mucilaginibacter sp. BT774]MDO3627533.1 hypothetical protein [Mucilaginibacter sp. BT774]
MSEKEENRSIGYTLQLKPDEYRLLKARFQKTQFRKMSEYMRSVLLEEPVTVNYRDKAMDDVLEELVLLRRELNAIGNNLNQAMHTIKAAPDCADTRLWMNLMSIINSKLEPSIAQIKERMNQYADIWSQKLRAVKA